MRGLFFIYLPSMFYDLFSLVNNFSPNNSWDLKICSRTVSRAMLHLKVGMKPSVVYFWEFHLCLPFKRLCHPLKALDSKWLHPSSPTCTRCVRETPQHTFTLMSLHVETHKDSSFKYFIISQINVINIIYSSWLKAIIQKKHKWVMCWASLSCD